MRQPLMLNARYDPATKMLCALICTYIFNTTSFLLCIFCFQKWKPAVRSIYRTSYRLSALRNMFHFPADGHAHRPPLKACTDSVQFVSEVEQYSLEIKSSTAQTRPQDTATAELSLINACMLRHLAVTQCHFRVRVAFNAVVVRRRSIFSVRST